MANAYFTLVVWTNDTNMDEFKDMLESIDEQEYREFELYILDNNPSNEIETTIKEFFPDIVDKVHYRRLKKKSGGAYAYNIGAHFAEGNYLVFVGQHDRLNYKTLGSFNERIYSSEDFDSIIYTDSDELVGLDRMNPHFKNDFNKELLLQSNYIGEFFCLPVTLYKRLGEFNEKAQTAYVYEYLLRAIFKGEKIVHIPSLLYHKRVKKKTYTKEERAAERFYCNEHMALAVNYLRKSGVLCKARPDASLKKWHLEYDQSTFRRFSGDYIFIKDEKVKLFTRNNAKKMYAALNQPDVAVVGVRFIGRGFSVDNVGYIYDEDGKLYPAFHGLKLFRDSYEGLASMPRDVSTVDCGCCMIDEKVYRMLHGFDTKLSGQEALLDFCIRAKARGYRTVVLPYCIARYKNRILEEPETTHQLLLQKHGELISRGDMFYNKNLAIGMENYVLPGMENS